jgi:solute carrier family 25 (mitochondrial carnitine/acylcarnitine transporter), member 20/29
MPSSKTNERALSISSFRTRVAPWAAGTFSGIANLAIGHPFDTIKVRLQTASPGKFSGPLNCLVSTVKNEGVLSLYRGATPPLLGKSAIHALMFGGYAKSREFFGKPDQYGRFPFSACFLAGVVGGLAATPVATPIDQVKACLQVQCARYDTSPQKLRFSGPMDCARQLLRHRSSGGMGIGGGLFRYMHVEAMEMCFMGFFFSGYELALRALSRDDPPTGHARTKPPPLHSFVAGGCGGTLFWVLALPVECVKNRLMTTQFDGQLTKPKYVGVAHCAQSIYRDGGLRSFWRGAAPAILRTFPTNGATFVAYEFALRLVAVT